MKTTICAIGGRRVSVDNNYLRGESVLLTIDFASGLANFAALDSQGAAVLGQALLDLAKKIEDEKQFPAALTSGIDWQQVNAIAQGNA